MENKLKVYPVMLPTQDKSAIHKVICNDDLYYIGSALNHLGSINQHLYLTSNREIEEGNWMHDKRDNYVGKASGHRMHPDYEKAHYRRIEATTDKSLGLPLIPESFIKEWVEKQGKIEYIYIALKDDNSGEVRKEGRGGEREVTVLPTKDSFTLDDMREAWRNGSNSYYKDEGTGEIIDLQTFDEWFSKTY